MGIAALPLGAVWWTRGASVICGEIVMHVPDNVTVCFVCRDKYGISVYKVVQVGCCHVCGLSSVPCYVSDAAQDIDWTIYDMSNIEFTRASADAVCRQCGKTYRDHPVDRRPEYANWQGDPFLHVLCNGKLVKL